MLHELVERAAKPGHRDLAVRVKGRQQLIPAALVAIEPPGLDQLGAGEFVFQTHVFTDSQVAWMNKLLGWQVFLAGSWTAGSWMAGFLDEQVACSTERPA